MCHATGGTNTRFGVPAGIGARGRTTTYQGYEGLIRLYALPHLCWNPIASRRAMARDLGIPDTL
jgi:hypothetical protein